ncbi:MAG: pseudaminic acid biosynthesis-associated methylase [Selenomonas sp.]|nr:pseudaminic acid biosynthesis-associated methylase [Selenomonas sp.]
MRSALELGPNIGLNLIALQRLVPGLKATAVEINAKAAEECAKIPDVTVVQDAFLNYKSEETFDLTFTFGVLIIQHPDTLPQMYDLLYKHSNRYILMSEYYNPTPTHVNYRGTQDKMFKRDFAGEFMDRFPDVQLVDYGFFYHRDSIFPADDFNWFLMEKR